jgi:ATP-dependent RNA helicase RhlE
VKFSELGLIPEIQAALKRAGYQTPTPIQQQAIEPALQGKDVLGCAQTGTGKTAAFCLPILQRIDEVAGNSPMLRALILTPTRELAAQIGESLKTYGRELDLEYTVLFGGVSEKPQIEVLRRGIDILVATPGRLLDLMQRGFVRLDRLEIFVLDEADRMLDMGFIVDVRKIVAALPKRRQSLLFSATMPREIRDLATALMEDPVEVAVTPVSSTAEKIKQQVYFTDKPNKRKLLLNVLESPEMKRTLVFSRTKHGANRIVKYLDAGGIPSAAIHGNKSQGARTRALEGFRSGELPVLVATDIAARGIDIDGVTHVLNFDLPNVPETYVHRIGRTARAGAEGVALSFCESEERPYLVDIERLIQRHIERVEEHDFPPTEPLPALTDLSARRGRSPGKKGAGREGRPAAARSSNSARGHQHDRRPRGHKSRARPGRSGQTTAR